MSIPIHPYWNLLVQNAVLFLSIVLARHCLIREKSFHNGHTPVETLAELAA